MAEISAYLTVAVSSRALFDLQREDEIFQTRGLAEYRRYQIENEEQILQPGPGFPLVRAILNLNRNQRRRAEVVVMSRNTGDTSMRIFNSIKHYGLQIEKAALTGGTPVARYLGAYKVDLFLSRSEEDVQAATAAGFAAGLIYDSPAVAETNIERIHIAFDGDAVLFSDHSQRIYDEQGLNVFLEHEERNAKKPLSPGPFAKLLKTISFLQKDDPESAPIRTALVTARSSPAHERVLRTLQNWKVRVDEVFFLGPLPKDEILKQFGAHIFFDDQPKHCQAASKVVTAALVPRCAEEGAAIARPHSPAAQVETPGCQAEFVERS